MSYLILVPALVGLFWVLHGQAEKALLSIYLPALLFLPQSYNIRIPHLPPTSAAEFAVIPIGTVAIARWMASRSFRLMDLLVLAYVFSIGATEITHEPVLNDGIFSAVTGFIDLGMTYFVGRQLIEPHLREVTVRRIVVLILFLGPLGLFEWRMGQNLYGIIGWRFLGISAQTNVQLRGSHGRMGGSFTDAEIAGIAFAITFALNAWLAFMNKIPGQAHLGKTLEKLEKRHIPSLLLLAYLWLTQSRGPEAAIGAALIILQVPKFKNTRMATVLALVLVAVGFSAAYVYYEHYTDVQDMSQVTEQQGSAIYRREMNELYRPIAEEGGWMGWGLMRVPHLNGMLSIDNEFLRVWLAQGRLGLMILILITAETTRTLIVHSLRLQSIHDKAFVFSMLAATAVLWFSLLTVYMGEQLPQYAFLLLGWCQSIKPGIFSMSAVQGPVEEFRYSFRRVFQ